MALAKITPARAMCFVAGVVGGGFDDAPVWAIIRLWRGVMLTTKGAVARPPLG